jgi:hypothetical protein
MCEALGSIPSTVPTAPLHPQKSSIAHLWWLHQAGRSEGSEKGSDSGLIVFIIVGLGVHCDIYKSSYTMS